MAEVRRLAAHPDEHAVLRRTAPLLHGHRGWLALAVLLNLAGAGGVVAISVLFGMVTDAVLDRDRGAVVVTAVAVIVVAGLALVLEWIGHLAVVRLGESVVQQLRDLAVARIAAAPLRFIEAHRRGDLVRRTTGEMTELSGFVGRTLPDLVSQSLLVAVTVIVLASYSWVLTGVVVAMLAAAVVVLGRRYLARAGPALANLADAEAGVSASFAESLSAHEQIGLLGARSVRGRQLREEGEGLLAARIGFLHSYRWLVALGPAGGLTLVVLVALSAWGLDQGWLGVGGAVTFIFAARGAFGDVEDLVDGLGELRAARTVLARLLDLLDATEIELPAGAVPPAPGDLVLDSVGYRYDADGRPALVDVSMRLAPGDHVAVVGETGSGKTTLGKVLAGFYPADEGSVCWRGVAIDSIAPSALRRAVACVPQEVVLAEGSIADNLAMLPGVLDTPAWRGQVLRTAAELGLGAWLARLPTGLDTEVGEHGSRISAGERQVVALLRAALADPAILVLDEATADVDAEIAAVVEGAVARLGQGRITVVIAHRPDTIGRAARVIRLAEARRVG
ncbi:MAG: ABC transporter ATP-binding protein [Nocardioides sp.]|uniref:ABC transporter ATP-binding protein n=1 Tax=Nocardioides sp. TaxID=35761 RepID=UPI0039E337C1